MHQTDYKVLSIEEVDVEDRSLAGSDSSVSFPRNLYNSIRDVGILVPVRLTKRNDGRYRIISGFRRVQVARELGVKEIEALIVQGSEDLKLFESAIWENASGRGLDDLEIANVLSKLSLVYGVTEERLLDEFLPMLSVKPTRYYLSFYFDLAKLPLSLKTAVSEGVIVAEIALRLGRWKEGEQLHIVGRLRDYRLGRNKQKQLFELLDELRSQRSGSVMKIWSELGLDRIDDDENLPHEQRFRRVRTVLMEARYPSLMNYEKRYSELKRGLSLPPGMRLDVPEYFEGESLSVSISASSQEQLIELADALKNVSERKEIGEIFSLL